MRRLPLLLVCLAMAAQAQPKNDPDKKEWRQLFDGRTLDGWTPKITGYELGDNFAGTFRAGDGVLRVTYENYDHYNGPAGPRFGHLFYREKFSHYIVAVEYRFVNNQVPGGPGWALRNSGIMVHCQAPESMTKDQNFPISIEVQLLGGTGSGPRTTANLCTPGTNVVMNGELVTKHCVTSSSKTYDGEQWVRAEAEVHGGDFIEHRVNGEKVLRYEKPQVGGGAVDKHDPAAKKDGAILTEGYISLQSESHPIEFRKVELLNLAGCMDSKAKNFKSYYVHAVPGDCRF